MINQETDASKKPNILELLDFCKGFFIACIVYYHFHKFQGVGWQGVHPFIVFSGFGLTYSCLRQKERGIVWKSWFLRRAERLLPTYWLVCLLGFFFSIVYIFKTQRYCDLSTCLIYPVKALVLEVSFIKVLSYQTMWSLPLIKFDHLWFIPLIISFYAVFPLLFKFLVSKGNVTKNCIRLLVIALLIEFSYRFVAIYFLDGLPLGHNSSIFGLLPPPSPDSLPSYIPFKELMPFGLFPSRIGEFVLGMTGAVALTYHPQKLNMIFSSWVVGLGFLIWMLGCALLYVRIGWVATDFFIALGLVVIIINLAWLCQQHFSFLFSQLSTLGIWSYYIYLVHNFFTLVGYKVDIVVSNVLSLLFQPQSQTLLLRFMTDMITMAIFTVPILLTSWMLLKFDQSKLPKWLIQNTIGRFWT